jgi:hypothetical protein
MTGAEHAAEATRLLVADSQCTCDRTDCEHGRALVAEARAHATLAVARELADLRQLAGGIRDEIKGLR